jgi:hypothetical protein
MVNGILPSSIWAENFAEQSAHDGFFCLPAACDFLHN